MVLCVCRVLRRGSVLVARLQTRDWRRRQLAALTAPKYSTKAAPNFPGMDYQDAVCTLNTLQTNASALEQVRRERCNNLQLQAMRGFLERAGLTVKELDSLNIIHVTGTKGKGSTCAFTEKILRSYGFRTGFYSSPHLVQVRERIRINGRPIAKDLFTKYFWQIYGRLDETKEAHDGTMPAYFRFLTILAFHVFLQEKVELLRRVQTQRDLGDRSDHFQGKVYGETRPGERRPPAKRHARPTRPDRSCRVAPCRPCRVACGRQVGSPPKFKYLNFGGDLTRLRAATANQRSADGTHLPRRVPGLPGVPPTHAGSVCGGRRI